MRFPESLLLHFRRGARPPAPSLAAKPQSVVRIITGPLRYAVIGAGSVARVHVNDFLGKPDVALVGIADPAPRTSWRIPEDLRAGSHFSDAATMLHETRPHVVSVCTPPRYHRSATLLALRAGAHVVCEKPMAMTIGEAEEMEAARAAAGSLGAVNFSYRNLVAFRFARQIVAKGELGPLTRVSVVYLQSFMAASATLWSWRHDARTAGFGALGDLGVHMIDGVRFVTGREFQRVVALARTLVPEKRDGSGVAQKITTDTHAMFLAELDGNTLAMFETTQLAPGYGDLFRIEVSGTLGTLCVDSEHPDEIRLHAAPMPPRHATWKTDIPAQAIPSDFEGRNSSASPGAIVDAIRGAEVAFPTFADGIAAQRVLGALEGSIKSGAWVAVRQASA